jgi:hypothetical protein
MIPAARADRVAAVLIVAEVYVVDEVRARDLQLAQDLGNFREAGLALKPIEIMEELLEFLGHGRRSP